MVPVKSQAISGTALILVASLRQGEFLESKPDFYGDRASIAQHERKPDNHLFLGMSFSIVGLGFHGDNGGSANRSKRDIVTEEDAIKLIRSGGKAQDAGIRALYQVHAQRMLRNFVFHSVSADDSQDILQETFVKIVRGAESYSGAGTAKAWIWQVARNCLTDYWRKKAHLADHEVVVDEENWQKLEETIAEPAQPLPGDSVDTCVSAGLTEFGKQMPERAYVLQLQMEGNSIEEIGRQIDRTVAATKQYLYECRKKIQPFIAHCTELLAT